MDDTNVKMAEPLGVNIVMMDSKLTALIDEAETIESQVSQLIKRLTLLKQSIAGYAQPVDKQNPLAQTPVSTETAMAKPEALLPVSKLESKPLPKSSPQVEKSAEVEQPTTITTTEVGKSVTEDVAPKSSEKMTAKNGVMDVRVGVHSNKTRLVFDIVGSTEYQLFHDKDVGIFTITLPDTPWATVTSKTYKFDQLAGYEAKPSGNGTIVAMAIKNTSDVKILALDKTSSKPARLVVDLIK